MKTLEITEAEVNKITYNDRCIANVKSAKQLNAMGLKEKNRILKIRQNIIAESYKKVRNEPRVIFINSRMEWMEREDLTPEIIEKEEQFYY